MRDNTKRTQIKKSSSKYVVLTLILSIFVLQIAEDVFIPIALAILLSFVLTPMVVKFTQWRFPKSLAIFTSATLAFLLIILLGWMVSIQAVRLAQNIPQYKSNVVLKFKDFNKVPATFVSYLTDFSKTFKKEDVVLPSTQPLEDEVKQKPLLVEFKPPKQSIFTQISVLSPLLGPIGTGSLTIIFVIAILFQREDLRERFILLISQGNLNLATQAIDDATSRITQYLVMNLIINAIYGVAICIDLYLIGVPNAFLWGLLTTLLRFIPYLGAWIAASFPLILAFSVDPGWSMLLMTISLFLFVEFGTNYFLEPHLYGASTGMSPIALLVASVFWTWLWGVGGLFLSVPLTVCIYVLGKYVAGLEFLEILLSSEPVLNVNVALYQRLLAMDKVEIAKISRDFLKKSTLNDYYDLLLIPALSFAKEDRRQGLLAEHRQKFIFEYTRELIDELGNEISATVAIDNNENPNLTPDIICVPARDEFDELIAYILATLLKKENISASVIECVALSDDTHLLLRSQKPNIICISSLPPHALSPARHFYKRIKRSLPRAKVVVAIWGASASVSQLQARWEGCDAVVVSIKDALTQIKTLSGVPEEALNEPTATDLEPDLLTELHKEDFINISVNELSLTVIKKLAKTFDVPISLVAIIETDRHFWKSYPGLLPEPYEAHDNLRSTPICEHIVTRNETLIVENIEKESRFTKNAWLHDRGILFFAGTPLRVNNDQVVGVLSVIDTKPREVTGQYQLLLESLAAIFMEKVNASGNKK